METYWVVEAPDGRRVGRRGFKYALVHKHFGEEFASESAAAAAAGAEFPGTVARKIVSIDK